MKIDELQKRYENDLVKAAKPINRIIHDEIVNNLKELKRILKLDRIEVLMGMGGWSYQDDEVVDCIEIFEGEETHYKVRLRDLEFKSYEGRNDVVDKSILPIIDRLHDLFEFLVDNQYTQEKDFTV